MAQAARNILIVGMNRPMTKEEAGGSQSAPAKTTKQVVLEEMEKARAAGYDCTFVEVDPQRQGDGMSAIREKLQSRHWDLFIVGFGLRGNAALTEFFEDACNACVELSPGTKFGFSSVPNAALQTIQRLVPRN